MVLCTCFQEAYPSFTRLSQVWNVAEALLCFSSGCVPCRVCVCVCDCVRMYTCVCVWFNGRHHVHLCKSVCEYMWPRTCGRTHYGGCGFMHICVYLSVFLSMFTVMPQNLCWKPRCCIKQTKIRIGMGYLGLLAPKDNFNFPEHFGSYIVFS